MSLFNYTHDIPIFKYYYRYRIFKTYNGNLKIQYYEILTDMFLFR